MVCQYGGEWDTWIRIREGVGGGGVFRANIHKGHDSLTLDDQKYLPVTAFVNSNIGLLKIPPNHEYIYLLNFIP